MSRTEFAKMVCLGSAICLMLLLRAASIGSDAGVPHALMGEQSGGTEAGVVLRELPG